MKSAKSINKQFIKSSIDSGHWGFGNSILYDLCKKYPKHTKPDVVIGKTWLIGRSYAAAIERRRMYNKIDGDYYVKVVGPHFVKAGIDNWLSSVARFKQVSESNLEQILDVHNKFTSLLNDITGLRKRSLASKYLHFHKPNLFFIYDSRAITAARKLSSLWGIKVSASDDYDWEYEDFCLRCLQLCGVRPIRFI